MPFQTVFGPEEVVRCLVFLEFLLISMSDDSETEWILTAYHQVWNQDLSRMKNEDRS